MKYAIVLLAVVAASSCSFLKGQGPSDALVISRFEFAPATGKAPLSGEFIVEVSGDATCAIEPNVRAVSCSGRKAWTVTASGDYVLTATTKQGKSVSSVARVTITP